MFTVHVAKKQVGSPGAHRAADASCPDRVAASDAQHRHTDRHASCDDPKGVMLAVGGGLKLVLLPAWKCKETARRGSVDERQMIPRIRPFLI